ncbi:hypothetical protein O5511_20550 [Escherichia coli]|nr:hypothetical protein [Escherichia coli]
MASQYKEKIANGTDLTAQQIANMNHIVVEQLHQRRPEYSVPDGGVQHHLLRFPNRLEGA